MDIFGKYHQVIWREDAHVTLQDAFEAFAKAAFENIDLVVIGKGFEHESAYTLIVIKSAVDDEGALAAICDGMSELFDYEFHFTVEPDNDDILIAKPNYIELVQNVYLARVKGFAAVKAQEEQRLIDLQRQLDEGETPRILEWYE